MSTLSVTNLKNAASATNNLVLNPDGSVNISGGTLSPQTGFKNRLINPAMVIDQRNAGASVGTASGTGVYTVDRWQVVYDQTNKFTAQQNAGAVTPPAGYTNYVGITSSSAYTVGASEQFAIRQFIEGFNTADLGWGTANAQTVTLSFWVRSSLTGTFGGVVGGYANTNSYPFTYTISAANTWEQKTVTITGATAGTWNTGSSGGIGVVFGLGVGSALSGTAGAWSASRFWSATGATSVVGTSGATFYITGTQLERGSVATPFEFRSIGQELDLCERYFESIAFGGAGSIAIATSNYASSTTPVTFVPFKTKKRASPTISFNSAGGVRYVTNTGIYGGNSASVNAIQVDGFTLSCTSSPIASFGFMDGMGTCSISSEL